MKTKFAMQANFQINIQNPCHEAWEGFKPTSEGGFCDSCQKNVIDFSKMCESQIVAYFRDLSNENQNLCGRFRDDQLQKNYRIEEWFPTFSITDKIIHYEIPISQFGNNKSKISLPLIHRMKVVRNMTIAILTFAIIEQGYGQEKQLTGKVIDASDGSPLSGVSIAIKGTKRGVTSDVNGRYQIAVNEQDTLVFSSVGFEHKILIAKEIVPILNMKMDTKMLDEVVVIGYVTKRRATITSGGISVCHSNNLIEIFPEKIVSNKYKTELQVLGNPTVSEEVIIIPKMDEKVIIENPEERDEAVDWYTKNGFQHIEDVQVYDLSGKVYKTSFEKINDGKIKINLNHVPSGIYLVRVKYANERSIENEEVSVVRIWIMK